MLSPDIFSHNSKPADDLRHRNAHTRVDLVGFFNAYVNSGVTIQNVLQLGKKSAASVLDFSPKFAESLYTIIKMASRR